MAPRLQFSSSTMALIRKLSTTAAILALAAAPLFGAARLTYLNNVGLIPLAWPDGSLPIRYSIDRLVANTVPQAAAILDRARRDRPARPDTNLKSPSIA